MPGLLRNRPHLMISRGMVECKDQTVKTRRLQRLAEFAERVASGLAPALLAAERAVAVDLIAEATVAACRQIDQMFGGCGRNAP